MASPRVLVTGFAPFLGESLNPSSLLLNELQQTHPDLKTLLLPVSFENAFAVLGAHLAIEKYDIILLLGQAGGRTEVNLERVALNWTETDNADEEGMKPDVGPIAPGEAEALFTSLPIENWARDLKGQGHKVTVSLSAGGFVCNDLYYKMLLLLKMQSWTTQCCFIHVPYIPEQVVNKPEKPSMPLQDMKVILSEIIKKIES